MAHMPHGPHAPRPAWPEAGLPQQPIAPRPACHKVRMPQGQHGIWPACPKVRLPQVSNAQAHLCYRAPCSACAMAHIYLGPHAPELDCPEPRAPLLSRPKVRAPHGPHAPGTFYSRALQGPRAALAARLISARFSPCATSTSPEFPTARILPAHKFARPEIRMPSTRFRLPRPPLAKNSNGQQLHMQTAPPVMIASSWGPNTP